MPITLGNLTAELARARPHDIAVVCGDARYTYRELDDRARRLAGVLAGTGFSQGGRVVWLGRNCHRLLEALLATARCGAVFCPLNWRLATEELRFLFEDLRPSVVLWEAREQRQDVVSTLRSDGPSALWIQHDGDDDTSYEARVGGATGPAPSVEV